MISNCPEKLKMARQQLNAESKPTGFVATLLQGRSQGGPGVPVTPPPFCKPF